MTVQLIGCAPIIMKRQGPELTLRFGDVEERLTFEEAVRVARLNPDEFRAEYAKKNGTAEDGTIQGDVSTSVE